MSDVRMKDLDEITSFLGDYGFFQILVIVILSVSSMICGYTGMLPVFLSDTPEHHCKVSINSTRNHTGAEVDFLEQIRWIGPDSCSRYTAGSSNETEPCVDGWVFSTERYTIVSEWELVCDSAWKVPLSTSLFFAGVLTGCFVCGDLSDRFGRKPVFFFTMAVQTVMTLIQAISVNWVMFCVLNFMRGFGQISNYITAFVLGSEILSKTARVSYALLGHSLGFYLGYVFLPLFAYFIRSWKMLLIASAMPGILFIPTWWVIPESPRWLLQKGRVEEAELVIRAAAKRNRVPAPEIIIRADECLELMKNKDEEKQTYTYLDLIRTPNIRNITFLSVFIWISTDMVYYGLSLNTNNLNGNAYLNSFISAAIDIVVCVATWLLVNHVPRPTYLFSALMSCGILLLVIKLVPEDMHVMFQVLALMGKIGASASYSIIYMFFTELFPTVVRSMGLGIASTTGHTGSIMCPFVIYLGVYSKILPYIVFGTVSIMAAAAGMLLPDTRNSKLPDHISQARPIRGCCCPKETAASQSDKTL